MVVQSAERSVRIVAVVVAKIKTGTMARTRRNVTVAAAAARAWSFNMPEVDSRNIYTRAATTLLYTLLYRYHWQIPSFEA